MKNNKKTYIIIITSILIVFLVAFIYRPRPQEVQNNVSDNRSTNTLTSTSTEETSTSTPSWGKIVFQNADCGATTTSSSISSSTGLTKYTDLTWKTKTITENSSHVHLDIKYPEFIGGNTLAKLNRCIYSIFPYIISYDKKDLAQIAQDDPTGYVATAYGHTLELSSSYHVVSVIDGIVSLEIVITDFTGGGAGNHDYSLPINWDLKSNRLLALSDIFCSKDYLSTLMPVVRKQLIGENAQYGGLVGWINDGTTNNPNNWGYFLIKDGGLTIVFQPYQVMSGSAGIVRTFVADSVKPHF